MTVILYNPKANNGTGLAHAEQWVDEHNEKGAELKSLMDIEDMGAFIAELGEEDKVILLGGDGTLNRFANNIRNITLRAQVYFAPAGTGNDFLHDVRAEHPEDPVPVNQYITNLPIVRVNGEERVFINGVGFGLDGYCCEVGDELQRKSDKPVKYSSIAIKGLLGKFKPRNATVTVDGVTKSYRKVWLAPAMNGRYYGGGIGITPDQDRLNADGTVTAAVVFGSGRIRTLLSFPKINGGRHTKMKLFEARVGHEITVRFDTPCALQVDGETYLNVTEYTVLSRRLVHPELFEEKTVEEEVVPV